MEKNYIFPNELRRVRFCTLSFCILHCKQCRNVLIFFNTCIKKVFFLRRKGNGKSNISSVWRGLPQ